MADAVVHYAEALAMRETSAMIDIPVSLESGERGRAQLLIGPASQLVVVPESGPNEEPEEEETIRALIESTAQLSNPHPRATDVDVDPLDEYQGDELT
ncbi:MAG: hypothetical protein JWQ12_103 [Glaciihabitans sp.]|nr:hypothetical protein [Glaciihabitans sp.]